MIRKLFIFLVWSLALTIHASVETEVQKVKQKMRYQNCVNQERFKRLSHHLKQSSFGLRVVTLNLGLLFETGQFTRAAQVNFYSERSQKLASNLTAFLDFAQPDVLNFQENWYSQERRFGNGSRHYNDVKNLNQALIDNGYLPLFPNEKLQSETGLQIAIRKELVDPERKVSGAFQPYQDKESYIQYSYLADWIPGSKKYLNSQTFERGLLLSLVPLKNGHTILLGNTHLASSLENTSVRSSEIAEGSAFVLKHLKHDKGHTPITAFIISGDFNFSATFSGKIKQHQTFIEPNLTNFLQFYHLSGFLDTGVIYQDTCSAQGQECITYAEDNGLFFQGSCDKGEPNQRLDQIWVGSFSDSFDYFASNSQAVLNTPFEDDPLTVRQAGGKLKGVMSDHYGYMTDLKFFPAQGCPQQPEELWACAELEP